ncbi:DoxX family protein [Nocardia brasiliensis]|uniref:DoxX family protein n=1 Tax=Nocardia brasiliensis TaxID=37326 RepID=UPI002455DCFE|nr:DoxX family protein [Nocardia brasiliensis]
MSAASTQSIEREITDGPEVEDPASARWNPLTRIAFRFCFTYFGLFCVIFPQFLFVYTGIFWDKFPQNAINGLLYPLSPVWNWAGRTVFGVDAELDLYSGSGDQAIIWIFVFCILIVALVTTAVWSVLDRHRPDYRRLNAWFLLFLRLCLGGQMLFYGMAKVIPTQMPEPPLVALLSQYGDFTPAAVLWMQVGSAPVYQILLGSAEVLGGLLLFWPRTATIGAMISLISMAQVFILNMTFDVPVKILSGHLLLISLVLLAPQARRLADVLVLQRPSEPAVQPEPFRGRRTRVIAVVVQIALGLWVLAGTVHETWFVWNEGGGGAAKPALYGIWSVSEFTQDGQPLPPLTTDQNRWQRVVFDLSGMAYQKMDGTLVPVAGTVDPAAHTITVSDTASQTLPGHIAQAQPTQIGTFTFTQPTPDRLRLEGEFNGHRVTVALEQMDLNSFKLRSTPFKWVQDQPRFS